MKSSNSRCSHLRTIIRSITRKMGNRLALAVLAGLLCAQGAQAQSTLLQGGSRSAGHVPMYVNQGSGGQVTVQDSGSAAGGGAGVGLSELLVVSRGTGTAPYAAQGTGPNGEGICFYDGPTNATAGYHAMCFSANAQGGGLISYQAGGAASALPFNFKVNGTLYEFPFTTSGVIGPATSVVNDAACWNNTSGTLLKDCGAFVTVGGNNTWTGTNNFTGAFQIGGAAQTFPASGNIVGTSDTQTLTNKSIAASQINSGTLPGTVMPAYTGNVTSSAGGTVNTIAAGVVINSMLAAASSANTVKGAATSTTVTDLAVPSCSAAASALQWVTGTGFQCGTLGATTAGWGVAISGGGVISIATAQPPYGFDVPINLGLTASVGGSALTINVVGANGSAPSATNPVSVPFRSTTAATGTPVWTAITSALSIVVPSAATLGTSNTVPFRIWLFLAYNGGTPELGVAVCSLGSASAATLYPCSSWENNGKTSITIDGFATSGGVLYVTTGVSNDSVRIIGYADYGSGLATAGAWASVPTRLQLIGPGIKRPGDTVQIVTASTTTNTTFNTAAYVSSAVTANITPTSTANIIKATATGTFQCTGGTNTPTAAIFRGTTQLWLPVACQVAIAPTNLHAMDFPGSASAQTYVVKVNENGTTDSSGFPTTNGGVIFLEEIMGVLDEPANDNIHPGVFSLTG